MGNSSDKHERFVPEHEERDTGDPNDELTYLKLRLMLAEKQLKPQHQRASVVSEKYDYREDAALLDGGSVKFDPNFHGPIGKRGCTDVLCCMLFIVFLTSFASIGLWAYTQGDPSLLLYPVDSSGRLCGVGDRVDKPYLFFFDMLECAEVGPAVLVTGCPTTQVCVSECPNNSWAVADLIEKEKLSDTCVPADREALICNDNVDKYACNQSVETLIENKDCAAYYVESSVLAGRCVPSFITDVLDSTGNLVNEPNMTVLDQYSSAVNGTILQEGTKFLATVLSMEDFGMKIYQDVKASWWMILAFLGIAMVWCFVWILLMRWLAGIMVWISILVFAVVFGFATYYCVDKYMDYNETEDKKPVVFTSNLSYYASLPQTWLILACISGIFLLIILTALIFLRSRIKIAVSLIKESSRAVGTMLFTLFWPIIPWALQIVLFSYWGASALYLASMGERKYVSSFINVTNVTSHEGGVLTVEELVDTVTSYVPCDPSENSTQGSVCNFMRYGGDKYTSYLQAFQLFTLFWAMNFIVALGQMTLAGAFASYYWAFQKPVDIPSYPIASSFWRCLRYHTGTLAFGSLVIAMAQMIRVVLEYLDHKLKNKDNGIAQFMAKCLRCCFWCLESFLKFLNRNAYIMTSIYGYNFCKAARTAFDLIFRNVLRVAVVDKVTDFIVFIGKLVVTGAICILALLFLGGELHDWVPTQSLSDYIRDHQPTLNFVLLPVIIIGVGSFVIASGFFAIYSMGVDTLFLCFLEDMERNDGSPEKPFYMSKELMKILGKKNKPKHD